MSEPAGSGEVRSPPLIGLVSDDFTGTSAAAARLADLLACRTIMRWFPDRLERPPDERDGGVVLAIDTETRTATAETARRRAAAAARILLRAGSPLIVKRFDSHLRGHVGPELEACLGQLAPAKAILTGAYPSTGKTTVQGVQLAHGTPVSETAMANDPTSPVRLSSIVELLGTSTSLRIAEVGLDTVRSPDARLLTSLEAALARADVVVCDAVESEDLFALARSIAILAATDGSRRLLVAGSDATLFALTRLHLDAAARTRPCLVVVGSAAPEAGAQVAYARKQPGVAVLELAHESVAPHGRLDLVADARTALEAGHHVILTGPRARRGGPTDATDIRARLTASAAKLVEARLVDRVIVIGGDTAAAFLESCEIHGIEEQATWGTAVVRGTAHRRSGDPITLVTRSGAVGSKTDLLELLLRLERQ